MLLCFCESRRHPPKRTHGQGTLANVDEVLSRLVTAGLKAKRKKCRMMELEVVYMGYIVDSRGHRPDHARIEAALKAPAPSNLLERQSYPTWHAELIYGQFIPRLATVL